MTLHEIINMAKESNLGFLLNENWLMHYEIKHFAKLVAQHEREACAIIADTAEPYKSADLIRARGQK